MKLILAVLFSVSTLSAANAQVSKVPSYPVKTCVGRLVLPEAIPACAGVKTDEEIDAVVVCAQRVQSAKVAGVACAGVKTITHAYNVDACTKAVKNIENGFVACRGVKTKWDIQAVLKCIKTIEFPEFIPSCANAGKSK